MCVSTWACNPYIIGGSVWRKPLVGRLHQEPLEGQFTTATIETAPWQQFGGESVRGGGHVAAGPGSGHHYTAHKEGHPGDTLNVHHVAGADGRGFRLTDGASLGTRITPPPVPQQPLLVQCWTSRVFCEAGYPTGRLSTRNYRCMPPACWLCRQHPAPGLL